MRQPHFSVSGKPSLHYALLCRDKPQGIPLRDVIHFKERQWYMEELQNSRDGDPNSMLRLAKMCLNGQGCEKNMLMAKVKSISPSLLWHVSII